MAFKIRAPREGIVNITVQNVTNPGCYTSGGVAGYVNGSLTLHIDGTTYSLNQSDLLFLGFGFLTIKSPVTLRAGQQLQITSSCDASQNSTVKSVLPREFSIGASGSVATCDDTIPLTISWKDYIRLSYPTNTNGVGGLIPYSSSDMYRIDIDSGLGFIPLQQSETSLEPDFNSGSVGIAGGLVSVNNTAGDNMVLQGLVGYPAGTKVRFTKLNMPATPGDFTFTFGNILIQNMESSVNHPLTDLKDTASPTIPAGTVYEITNLPSGYEVRVDGNLVFTSPVTFSLSDNGAGGSFSPTSAQNGSTVTYTLPSTPGQVVITAADNDFVLDQDLTLTGCPLVADPKDGGYIPGTVSTVPTLTGTAPTNCVVDQFEILTLPGCGILKLNGSPVTVGQKFPVNQAGNLTVTDTDSCTGDLLFTYRSISLDPDCQPSPAAPVVLVNTCQPVSGGVITGPVSASYGGTGTLAITGLSGTSPMTFNWTVSGATITGGQGTSTIQVQFDSLGSVSATVTVGNCSGAGQVVRDLSITVSPGTCEMSVPVKINCPPPPYSVKVTLLSDPSEPNRAYWPTIGSMGEHLVSWTAIKDGQAHDYLIVIKDANGRELGTVKILNRKCP